VIMTKNKSIVARGGAWLLGLVLLCQPGPAVFAQEYPSKPIRLIVGFTPGGSNDIVARIVAPTLAEILGVQVIVENRPGANAMIGTEYVARSAPDGYTLTLGSISPLILSPQVYTNTSYDTRLDFIGITSVAMTPQVIVASPKLPVQSLTDLVDLAKKKPGTLNIASSGTGSNSHVAIELFKLTAAINVSHVPYKGTAPALMDVIGGQIDGAFGDLPGALSQISTGKMNVLAVTSEKRHPLIPNVATTSEQGFSELLAVNWFAVMAPAKTPTAIVNKLHAALTQAIATPTVTERFRTLGLEAMPSASPDAFKAFLQTEYTRWGSVIQAASIRLE